MSELDEIMKGDDDTLHATGSEPLLQGARVLAEHGRFEEIGRVYAEWIQKFPISRHYVVARLPPIVLNSYLCKQPNFPTDKFTQWAQENPEWANGIRENASDSMRLPTSVAQVLHSIRKDCGLAH